MIDTKFYGLLTDSSKTPGSTIVIPKPSPVKPTPTLSTLSHSTSLSYIGIIILLSVLALIIPLIALILDRKDMRALSQQALTKSELRLLRKTAKLSQMPMDYWLHKNEEV